jgi:hypothetical protein
MTRFDAFCLRMIPICLTGAVIVGALQYRTDLRNLSTATHRTIPGCASGKYHCSVRYERGITHITMAMEANHENAPH